MICEDADLDKAVEATLAASFLNAGRAAPRRALPRAGAVREEYLSKLAAAVAERIHLGDPFDDATTMGPVNNEPTAAKTERHVSRRRARASIVVGGSRAGTHGSDLFFEATVLDGVNADMEIAREETFGPVVPVSSIRSEEEALEVVNGSPYGLLSAIFTRDLAEASGSPRPSGPDGST